jgi:hypothetical protein
VQEVEVEVEQVVTEHLFQEEQKLTLEIGSSYFNNNRSWWNQVFLQLEQARNLMDNPSIFSTITISRRWRRKWRL